MASMPFSVSVFLRPVATLTDVAALAGEAVVAVGRVLLPAATGRGSAAASLRMSPEAARHSPALLNPTPPEPRDPPPLSSASPGETDDGHTTMKLHDVAHWLADERGRGHTVVEE